MKIEIVWGESEGKTSLSAFDKALIEAGIHNFNLIPLSSVIPPGALVREVGRYQTCQRIGDILYIVIASFTGHKAGAQISAGLGWVQTEEGGLFLEAKGEYSVEDCEEEIRTGLEEVMAARGWSGEIRTRIIGHTVRQIANVTVAAVYNFEE